MDILELIDFSESPIIEFKEKFYNIDNSEKQEEIWNEFVKDIISLMNKNIGYSHENSFLIFGPSDKFVNKQREITSVSDKIIDERERIKADLIKKINSYCYQEIEDKFISCYPSKVNDKNILCFEVNINSQLFVLKRELKTPAKAISKETCLIRKNDGIIDAAPEELRTLLREEKIVAIKLSKEEQLAIKENNPITLNKIGLDMKSKKELDKAVIFLSKAIRLKNNYHNAYNNRGLVYFDMKRYGLALKDFDESISIKNDYADAYNNRGRTYYTQGNYDLAITDFDKAINLNEKAYNYYNNRGLVFEKIKNINKAREDFKKAIYLKSNYQNAIKNLQRIEQDKGE